MTTMPRWWIGRPGALRELRPPARDYDRSPDDQPATYRSTGGGASVDHGTLDPRTYRYQWVWMSRTDWTVLAGLKSRSYGPGPYALIDGASPNLLGANAAAGGAPMRSGDGYVPDPTARPGTTAPATVTAVASPTLVSDRSVAWSLPAPAPLTAHLTGTVAQDAYASRTFVVPAGTTDLTVTLALAAAAPPANANPGLETNTTGWTFSGGTFARSTAQHHTGAASGLLTPDGTSTVARAIAPPVAVAAGVGYTGSLWVYSPPGYTNITCDIDWLDASSTYLSTTTGSTVSVPAATWTQIQVAGAAPAGAAYASVKVSERGTPAGTKTLYVDDVALALADDLDLFVYDPTGALAGSGVHTGSNEQVHLTNPAAGTWTATIQGYQVVSTGSAAWTLDVAMTAATAGPAALTVPHPIVAAGWPVPADTTWTVGLWLRASAPVTATLAVGWYDTAGVLLSESTATAVLTTTGWQRAAVSAAVPAGAAYLLPVLRVPAPTAALSVYIGAGRLAVDDDSTDWWPGEGLPMVSIVGATEQVPVHDRRTPQISLQEVTA